MNRSPRLSRKRPLRIVLVAGAILLALVVAGSLTTWKVYLDNLRPVSSVQTAQTIEIPIGSSVKEIAVILENAGLVRQDWAFEWYVRLNGLREKMQAGTYSISPSQSVREISDLLTHGKEKTDQVTILPAQRIDQIRSRLINSGFTEEEVDNALNPSLYADHPALSEKPAEASLEGYLYPDTYQRTANTPPQAIIRASLDEMQAHLTPDVRAGIKRQNLTLHQGIIIASIIEKEVGNPADRAQVAQVFLRRLQIGMALGSDVTAYYGALINGQSPSVAYDSPYNTRLHAGLPPGPISNVSTGSLEALANPASGDYIFFVSGDDGKTYFSHTQAEHEALAREHCKKLCQE